MARHSHTRLSVAFVSLLIALLAVSPAKAADTVSILPEMVHLRQSGAREWEEFEEVPAATELSATFLLDKSFSEPLTLCFEQQDVKQTWKIGLNGADLGLLTRDENAMTRCLEITPDKLTQGLNEVRVWTTSDTPDDIRVGRISLIPQPRQKYLEQCSVSVTVTDDRFKSPLPCRITVLNQDQALQDTSLESSLKLAVRTGVIYTADGTARFGLPPGDYIIIAGRGPEYEIQSATLTLAAGEEQQVELELARSLNTTGWVACDTHVHTLTLSGHGDSTLDERLITIAGEGIELPIATEHNRQSDYTPRQLELGLEKWYTAVTGNEVTTKWGHFNIWPVSPEGPVPEYKLDDWKDIFQSIREEASPEIIILNHARDLHSGYRPFGIKHRHPLTGRRFDDWKLEANAMEIVNSGAQQTDMLQLPRDWMVCLNRGEFLTPVGCSDSHDVARHFVGQGRTYIKADDSHPGQIDVQEAVRNFREGRVIVSCPLIPRFQIEDKYGPGDLVPFQNDQELKLELEITSPTWYSCIEFQVFINGEQHRESESLTSPERGSAVSRAMFHIKPPKHDAHIEVIALGRGVRELYWPIAKPYQADSPEWTPLNFGMSGAIWYDGNNDGKKNSAREIAETLWKASKQQPAGFVKLLRDYDRAVCLQGAEIVHLAGHEPQGTELRELLKQATPQVSQAFSDYWDAWRESEIARAGGEE